MSEDVQLLSAPPTPSRFAAPRVLRYPPTAYRAVFERALSDLHTRAPQVAAEQAAASELCGELITCEPLRGHSLVQKHRRFQRLTVASRLVDESLSLARTRPGRAQELAELAIEIVPLLDRRRYGTGLLRDVQARAWASLSEIARNRGMGVQARTALETARVVAAEGSGDPLEQAQLWELAAGLAMDHGRPGEAADAMRCAAELYRQADDAVGLARVLARSARWHAPCLDPDGGERLVQALREIDPALCPSLAGLTAMELISRWSRQDRFFAAQRWLTAYRRSHPQAAWTRGLLLYLQGHLARQTRRYEDAAANLALAVTCLRRRGQPLPALRALLDLLRASGAAGTGERWVERIRSEAEQLAAESVEPAFRALVSELATAAAGSAGPEVARDLERRLDGHLDRGTISPLAPL